MLIFGVSIFSYIMGNLIESTNKIITYNDSLNQDDELAKFFGVLESFNYQDPIKFEIKRRIELYFEYRWSNDKNIAISATEDKEILE